MRARLRPRRAGQNDSLGAHAPAGAEEVRWTPCSIRHPKRALTTTPPFPPSYGFQDPEGVTRPHPSWKHHFVISDDLAKVSRLLWQRNEIDAEIAATIQRPMTAGHLGEWIASRVFDIHLELSAAARGIDGRFGSGPLSGKSVNVKWYLKREGTLDVADSDELDFYLVLAGPVSPAASSRGSTRPWTIDAIYLFDARALRTRLESSGVKIGIATSVRSVLWEAAEVYPRSHSAVLVPTEEQRSWLQLFRPK